MKRFLRIFALACAIICTSKISADTSLFNIGMNKDDSKVIVDQFFNRFDESAKKFFEIPSDGQGGDGTAESAAQKFIKALLEMSDKKMSELHDFGRSFLKTCAFMGLTGLSGCFAVHALHQTILAYIKYRNTTDNEQKEHADQAKYYATIACISGILCTYSVYSLSNLIAQITHKPITQILPGPFAQ